MAGTKKTKVIESGVSQNLQEAIDHEWMAGTKKTKVIESGVSQNLQEAIDHEWTATERSDDAEETILREYHYHLLRAEELKRFLHGCGMIGDE